MVRTHGSESVIGDEATVGPVHLPAAGHRAGRRSGKLGAFVETKNAAIGAGTKVPHLTYVGDADIGEHSNIGASSVFVNYDGEHKNRTTIGSHVRTGSDTMFVAPVTVGDGAYTGAGHRVARGRPARRDGRLGRSAAQHRGLGAAQAPRQRGRRSREARRSRPIPGTTTAK